MQRACVRMAALVLAAPLVTAAAAGAARAQGAGGGAALDADALGLPPSAVIRADVWAGRDWPDDSGSTPPNQRLEVERHPEWVRSRQWESLGELGWQLVDVRLDAIDESITLYPTKKTGQFSSLFSQAGYNSYEPAVTPAAWLRVMQWANKGRGTTAVAERDGLAAYTFDSVDGKSTVEVRADLAARSVRTVTVTSKSQPYVMSWEYLEDGPIAGTDRHHPRRVRYQVSEGGVARLRLAVRITSVESAAASPRPPRPAVPRDFIVTDARTGETLDGTYTRVSPPAGKPPLAPAPAPAPSGASLWLVIGGAGLLAAAGVVWQVRRRAVG